MADSAGIDVKVVELRDRVRHAMADAFSPLVNWFDQRNISPDQLTWLGLGLAILTALLAGFRVFTVAGIIYLIAGAVDLLDGALARRANTASGGGAFLDSVLDRAGEGVVHAGAAVAFAYWGVWAGVLAVALSLSGGYLTSYARARAEGLGIELPEVWFGRGERLVLLALGLIFHFAFVAFWILAVLCWASAAHRIWLARRRLAPAPPAVEAGEEEAEAGEDASGSPQEDKPD
ncbi:MAG: CDP-alcohol phosphatidyltransferase family protein [Gammaproteobacteria bacterium]|nr:CDP-alcohol phosphatidyltransferase family protein [Gammaproteobacteria bacterium]